MYTVTCPECDQVLDVPRPLQDARFRCGACGAVFVASTSPVGGSAAEEPTEKWSPYDDITSSLADLPPAQPPTFRRPTKPPPPQWVPLAAIGVLVASVMLVFVLWYFSSHPYVVVRGPDGREIFAGRVTRAEADRKRAEAARAGEQARKSHEQPGEGEAAADNLADELIREMTQAQEDEDEGDANRHRIGADGSATEIRAAGHANIRVTDMRFLGGVSGQYTLGGEVRNDNDRALRSLKLLLRYHDGEGMTHFFSPVTLRHIPATGGVRFSLDCGQLQLADIRELSAAATGIEVSGGAICLPVDSMDCQLERRGQLVILTGKARNDTATAIRETRIYCDFFTARGIHIGSAEGKLDEGAELRPGKRAWFTVQFDTTDLDVIPDVVERFVIRIVGRIY